MYNRPLRYLIKNDPDKVLSLRGVRLRRLFSPVFRHVIVPLSSRNRLTVVRKAEVPRDRPVIFAATHGFRDDVAFSLKTIGSHAYLLYASIPDFYESPDGYALWLNGVVLLDRKDKSSRRAAKDKMIRALSLGANLLLFPEGVWNKTENLVVQKLFPGVYDVAKATGAWVMPLASVEEDGRVYTILEEAFDICAFDRQEGLLVLRDKMATAKYELMDAYSHASRAAIGDAKAYWAAFLDRLVATARGHYDTEIENTAQFRDKNETTSEQAFRHLQDVRPDPRSAFLFGKDLKGGENVCGAGFPDSL